MQVNGLHRAAQVTRGGGDADVALAADAAAHRRLVVAGLAGTGGADADAQAHAVGGAGSPLLHGTADASGGIGRLGGIDEVLRHDVRLGGLVQAGTPLSQRHLSITLSYRRKYFRKIHINQSTLQQPVFRKVD